MQPQAPPTVEAARALDLLRGYTHKHFKGRCGRVRYTLPDPRGEGKEMPLIIFFLTKRGDEFPARLSTFR